MDISNYSFVQKILIYLYFSNIALPLALAFFAGLKLLVFGFRNKGKEELIFLKQGRYVALFFVSLIWLNLVLFCSWKIAEFIESIG